MDLKGLLVTTDALHTQRKTAKQIVAKGGDYFMVVKDNQPELRAEIELLFTECPPGEEFASTLSRTRHGDRFEERRLEASTVLNDYLHWPHLGQVCRIERRVHRKGALQVETSYAATSLCPERANPERLQRLWRGHWRIENKLHWVRDVTMGEDSSQVRTASAPQVMAALRNITLGLLHLAGIDNVAASLRHNARHHNDAFAMTGFRPSPQE